MADNLKKGGASSAPTPGDDADLVVAARTVLRMSQAMTREFGTELPASHAIAGLVALAGHLAGKYYEGDPVLVIDLFVAAYNAACEAAGNGGGIQKDTVTVPENASKDVVDAMLERARHAQSGGRVQ